MTSPSPANIAYNGNITTWWIPATNLSGLTATGVISTLTISPANGLKVITWETANGTFNKNTGVWTIGTLNPGATVWLKLVTEVVDIGLAPFTLNYVLSGNNIDPNNVNNASSQSLTSIVGAAVAGANDDDNQCNCVNVSTNDIACNAGITEYRLNVPSLTNVASYIWDATTGIGKFVPVDPFIDITFTYTIWCDTGSGFVETSGPATVTITAMFDSLTPWNHTADLYEYSDLTPTEIAFIEAIPKYASLTLSDFCWRLLKNGAGEVTSAEVVKCNEETDTRTFFFCTDTLCTEPLDPCPCPTDELPVDITAQFAIGYTPEIGDTIYMLHTNAYSIWTFDGTNWNKWSCGCQYKVSQDAGNLITLGTDNAPFLSEAIIVAATDEMTRVSSNDTTSGFLNGKLVAGTGITFTENNDGANETLTITATAPASSNVQAVDTPSINTTVTGTGTLMDPFLVSGAYNDGGPTPRYLPGTPGSTGNTLDVSLLFGMPCAGGYTPTYTLNGFSTDVYDAGTITLVGVLLTYDILETAPSGTHYINVQRVCA